MEENKEFKKQEWLWKINNRDFFNMYSNSMSVLAQKDVVENNGNVDEAKRNNKLKYASALLALENIIPFANLGITVDSVFDNMPNMGEIKSFYGPDMYQFTLALKGLIMDYFQKNTGLNPENIKNCLLNKTYLYGGNFENAEFSGYDIIKEIDKALIGIAQVNAEATNCHINVEMLSQKLNEYNKHYFSHVNSMEEDMTM